jgi:hypothetical protein
MIALLAWVEGWPMLCGDSLFSQMKTISTAESIMILYNLEYIEQKMGMRVS